VGGPYRSIVVTFTKTAESNSIGSNATNTFMSGMSSK
jgi:hypothetical protein